MGFMSVPVVHPFGHTRKRFPYFAKKIIIIGRNNK